LFNNSSSESVLQDVDLRFLGGTLWGEPEIAKNDFTADSGLSLGIHDKIARSCDYKRLTRYVLQHAAGEILPGERVAWCHKRMLPSAEFVAVFHSESEKRAHYANLRSCCQIWLCPVCAQKVVFERKKELEKGIQNYKLAGGYAYMLTFTLQHQLEDKLDCVMGDLLASVEKVFRCCWWQGCKKDIELQGRITALEIRWGFEAGWHPHKHLLLLCKKELTIVDQDQLVKGLIKRYCDQLVRRGAYADPDIGVVLTEDKDDGGYLAKWGIEDEMSKGAMKSGRSGSKTPFDLLLWSLIEYSQPAELFKEYWKNIKGCRQLVLHKGTRKLMQLVPVDPSDIELIARAPADDTLILQLAFEVWQDVCRFRKRGQLLDAVENGGLEAAERLLRGLYEL